MWRKGWGGESKHVERDALSLLRQDVDSKVWLYIDCPLGDARLLRGLHWSEGDRLTVKSESHHFGGLDLV